MNKQISRLEDGHFLPIEIDLRENKGADSNVIFYNSEDPACSLLLVFATETLNKKKEEEIKI